MGGSRVQVNKAHKTRFSSKSSRNLHKTSVKGVTAFYFSQVRFIFALRLDDHILFGTSLEFSRIRSTSSFSLVIPDVPFMKLWVV